MSHAELPSPTVIRPSGLRYESKGSGNASNWPAGTRSCLLCGRHVSRSKIETFTLAGSQQYRCKDGC